MKCISEDDECKLWESGVLHTDMPTELLNYVLLYNGKNLLMWRRGALVPQALTVTLWGEYCDWKKVNSLYVHKTSSCFIWAIKSYTSLKIQKLVDVIMCGSLIYTLLKFQGILLKKINIYVQPLESAARDPQKQWFTSVPMRRNKLSSMVKEMGNDAWVKGNKTNHSLCSLGVSLLHKHDGSEKSI